MNWQLLDYKRYTSEQHDFVENIYVYKMIDEENVYMATVNINLACCLINMTRHYKDGKNISHFLKKEGCTMINRTELLDQCYLILKDK